MHGVSLGRYICTEIEDIGIGRNKWKCIYFSLKFYPVGNGQRVETVHILELGRIIAIRLRCPAYFGWHGLT